MSDPSSSKKTVLNDRSINSSSARKGRPPLNTSNSDPGLERLNLQPSTSPNKRKRSLSGQLNKTWTLISSSTEDLRSQVEEKLQELVQTEVCLNEEQTKWYNPGGLVEMERTEKLELKVANLEKDVRATMELVQRHEAELSVLKPVYKEMVNVEQRWFENSSFGDFNAAKKAAEDRSAHVPNVHTCVLMFDRDNSNIHRFGLEPIFGASSQECRELLTLEAWADLANNRSSIKYDNKRTKKHTDSEICERIDKFTRLLLAIPAVNRGAALKRDGTLYQLHNKLRYDVDVAMREPQRSKTDSQS